MAAGAPAPVRLLMAGMVGSGSTFLYNVAREMLMADPNWPLFVIYSDEWNPAWQGQHHLVLKSHWGIRALTPLAETGRLLPVISVRHPGDCVCSDVERFGFTFAFALQRVALSLKFAGLLRRTPNALLFRYEDGFTSDNRAAARMAQAFGLRLPSQTLADISRRFDAEHVRAYADSLEALPGLMTSPDNPHDAWCPETHIHRGHVGKQTVGRWRDLPKAERACIDEVCGEEASSFGYDCTP
jgi:hypothetical protein